MKANPKIYLTLFILSAFGLNGWTQLIHSTKLNIDHLPQKKENWCWAATAQMVLKYYNTNSSLLSPSMLPAHNQCEITTNVWPASCGTISNCVCNVQTPCNTTLGLTAQMNDVYINKYNFSNGNLNIINLPNEVTHWPNVYNHIFCQRIPFVVNKKFDDDCGGSHIVLCKGYTISYASTPSGKIKFLYLNDPLPKCNGRSEEYLFHNIPTVEDICDFLMLTQCKACGATPSVNIAAEVQPVNRQFRSLSLKSEQFIPEFSGKIYSPLTDDSLSKLINNNKKYNLIPVNYLDTKKLNNPDKIKQQLPLDSFFISNQPPVYDIIYKEKGNSTVTVTRMQWIPKEKKWYPVKIYEYEDLIFKDEVIRLRDKVQPLKNYNDGLPFYKTKNGEIIRRKVSYPPSGYDFYSILQAKDTFLCPVEKYDINELNIDYEKIPLIYADKIIQFLHDQIVLKRQK